MHLSYAQFKTKHLGLLGRLCVFILKTLRLADIKEGTGEDQEHTAISNLTIINGVLYVFGPLNEGTLTTVLLLIQVIILNLIFICLNLLFMCWLISQKLNYSWL